MYHHMNNSVYYYLYVCSFVVSPLFAYRIQASIL